MNGDGLVAAARGRTSRSGSRTGELETGSRNHCTAGIVSVCLHSIYDCHDWATNPEIPSCLANARSMLLVHGRKTDSETHLFQKILRS